MRSLDTGVSAGRSADASHIVFESRQPFEPGVSGKQVWECAVTAPLTPHRLSNGHTLVASHFNMQITEIDRTGKIVNEMKGLTYRPFRVQKR